MKRQQLPSGLYKLLHQLDKLAKKKKISGYRQVDIAEKTGFPLNTLLVYIRELDKLGFISRGYHNKSSGSVKGRGSKIIINILK